MESDETIDSPEISDNYIIIGHEDLPETKSGNESLYDEFLSLCKDGRVSQFKNIEKKISGSDDSLLQMYYINGFVTAAEHNNVNICRHIYRYRNPDNGKTRNRFKELLFSRIDQIDPKLFLKCCSNQCLDTIRWMLSIETFSIDTIELSFRITIENNDYKLSYVLMQCMVPRLAVNDTKRLQSFQS